jgi:AraC family transcriptional regulator
MDSLEAMNGAIHYIENHLTGEIDVQEAARRAHCSEYHFKRVFSFLAGVSLSEYIRRRRLTLAAFDLKDETEKVIDISMKYGYQSPDAFARAFRDIHGITPSEARTHGHLLKAFPKMTFQLTIKGGKEMNYRIEQKEAFRIAGMMKRVPIVFEGENPEIAAMWKSVTAEKKERLQSLSNTEPEGIVQASTNFSEGRMEEKGSLDHYIGAATTKEPSSDLDTLNIPDLTWGIFEAVGPFPEALQETWGKIYAEWFPSSNYEVTEGPEILSIQSDDLTSETVKCEIWIPIVKKP